ncbi:FAD-dependent oxidoreductase [Streptomyces sp. NPDC047123]|uniref:NAD(P)/FAD-dependent oxidoreductase n=1 Tax=Streptomyces sp. NPDC047123 TaxID=3155622 RepID=UPI0033FD6226
MKHRIVVLGAGYAGAITAGRLARRLHRDDVEITLVNADPDFVERVRLHQLAAGQDLPRRPLHEVYAGTGVQVRTARVTAVDAEGKRVDLTDERGPQALGYDTLVYALGSTVADHDIPGAAEHASHIAGKEGALRLRARLGELMPGARVLVAGGGLTAIEAAAEIAESHPHLKVAVAARAGVGDWLSDKARRYLRTAFQRLGITLHEHTDITEVHAEGVLTDAGHIPADVTVWTAGFRVHPIAAATTLKVSGTGQIVVDATLRSLSHPDVYAVGDAALAPGAGGIPLRMGCATATPMAWQAADALAARLTGRKVPQPVIGYVAQCVSLGRCDAIVQRVTKKDEMTPIVLTGRVGARIKELICASTLWGVAHPTMLMPARRHRLAPTTTEERPRLAAL